MGLAFLITSDNLQLLSERKVLKEAEYAAMLDAAGVIEAANGEAERIRLRAVEAAQQDCKQAYARGLEQARVDEAARRIDAALQTQQQLEALRDAMARLVTKAVMQLVAQVDPSLVFEAALGRIDALVRDESFVSVRVAAADEAALRSALDTLRNRMGWTLKVVVQPDVDLPAGACVMQTASGSLDLGVQAQLDAFARATRRDMDRSEEAAA